MVSNSKPIRSVLREALDHLHTTGTLSITEWVTRYPEHTADLVDLLPVMEGLQREALWERLKRESCQFAVSLFTSPAGEG